MHASLVPQVFTPRDSLLYTGLPLAWRAGLAVELF